MILVCGEALYDVFFAEERADGFLLDARIGGSAFNVAVALGRLDQDVGLLTGVSRDRTGAKLVDALRREGVATSALAMKDAPTTLALVEVTGDGSARYTFLGEGAADRAVTPADVPDLSMVDVAVFGCFSLLTQPTGDTFLQIAQGSAALNVLDPNIRPTVEPDMAVWRERVGTFAASADVVKLSEEDAGHLYPGQDLDTLAADLRAAGATLIAVTRGGEGSRVYAADDVIEVPGRRVDVIDTVGAGDSFLGALIAGIVDLGATDRARLAGLPLNDVQRIVERANAAAALACTRRGADPPRLADLPPL